MSTACNGGCSYSAREKCNCRRLSSPSQSPGANTEETYEKQVWLEPLSTVPCRYKQYPVASSCMRVAQCVRKGGLKLASRFPAKVQFLLVRDARHFNYKVGDDERGARRR